MFIYLKTLLKVFITPDESVYLFRNLEFKLEEEKRKR